MPSDSSKAVLLLIPELGFNAAELEELHMFIRNGGTLILADDFGFGNQVLESLDTPIRFSGKLLIDPILNYRNPALPKIARFEKSQVTDNISSLSLNYATTLDNTPGNEVLGASSSFSFQDNNGNRSWNPDEPSGPLTVMAAHAIGSGRLIILSDPSIFINGMLTKDDNLRLLTNITELAPVFYFDQSHLPDSRLHQAKTYLEVIRAFLKTPAGTVGLIIAGLWLTTLPLWYKRIKSPLRRK